MSLFSSSTRASEPSLPKSDLLLHRADLAAAVQRGQPREGPPRVQGVLDGALQQRQQQQQRQRRGLLRQQEVQEHQAGHRQQRRHHHHKRPGTE